MVERTEGPAPSRGPTALTKNRGSGLEEYFADPPLTATEAQEEREIIYSPARPLVERIEECIQRFRARRRMNSELTKHFDQFLFLGGIDASPKQFGGFDARELRDFTPSERRDLRAADSIHRGSGDARFYNPAEPDKWEVDFTGVMAGFLSELVAPILEFNERDGLQVIAIVEAFLRYVLQHDVCNEYADDIRGAMGLCELAREELPRVYACSISFPGEFNLAAKTLFRRPEEVIVCQPSHGFQQPEDFDARTVFNTAIALVGDSRQAGALQNPEGPIEVVGEQERDLEVVEIRRPSAEIIRVFQGLRISPDSGRGVPPVGTAVFKPCVIEDGWDHQVVDDFSTDDRVTLFFDDHMLRLMKPGFKFRFLLAELSSGVTFVKELCGVFPTFHRYPAQMLMTYYKEPVPNPRPASSVMDPHAEERDEGKAFQKDI